MRDFQYTKQYSCQDWFVEYEKDINVRGYVIWIVQSDFMAKFSLFINEKLKGTSLKA